MFDFERDRQPTMSSATLTLAVDPAYDFEAWHADVDRRPDKHMIDLPAGGELAIST